MGTGGFFLRRLRARVADEPTGFVWVAKGTLAGSGFPSSRGQLDWVREQGIDTVITLTQSPIPSEYREGLPMMFDHVPMGDHEAPSQEQLGAAAELIQRRLEEGRKVLVHCLAGQGRTGCALAAYLIRTKRMGAGEALQALREVKDSFVEWSQEKSLYEFAEKNGHPR